MKKKILILLSVIIFLIAAAFCAAGVKNSDTYHFELRSIKAQSGIFLLPSGSYNVSLSYRSDTDTSATVAASDLVNFNIPMPATGGSINTVQGSFTLPYGTDRGKIKFSQEQSEHFRLTDITLTESTGHGLLYTDYIYAFIILCLIYLFCGVLYLRHRKHPFTAGQLRTAGILLLMILLSSLPWFVPDMYFELDTRAHMLRIEGVYEGLMDHQLPVIIYPNYCNDFGQLGILYPDIFLYFPAILRRLGVSMISSYRSLMLIICIAKVLVMYYSAGTILRSEKAALLATAVFIFEPYRMYDTYFRGAAGGSEIAGLFLPLLIAGVYSILYNKNKKWYLLAFGMTGILQSHILSLALTCILLIVFVILFIKDLLHREALMALAKAVVLALALNIGLLLPFIHFYFSGWNRDVLQWASFFDELAGPYQMFFYDFSFFTLFIIAFNTVCFFILREEDRKEHRIWLSFFAAGVLFYLMSTKIFPWHLLTKINAVASFCSMMQTPRRFLLVATTLTSVVFGRNLTKVMESGQKKQLVRMICGVTAVLCISCTAYQYARALNVQVLFDDPVEGDINSKLQFDYVPEGTTEDDIHTDAGTLSDENDAVSIAYDKHGTHIDYTYSNAVDGAYADLPLLYYDGYTAHDQDGKPMRLEMSDHHCVRVYLEPGDGEKQMHVRYEVKPLYTVCWIFSALLMAVSVGFCIRKKGIVFSMGLHAHQKRSL